MSQNDSVDPSAYPIMIESLHRCFGTPDAWQDLKAALGEWFAEMIEINPEYRAEMLGPGDWNAERRQEEYVFRNGAMILGHSPRSTACRDAVNEARTRFRQSIVARLKSGEIEAVVREAGIGRRWQKVSAEDWTSGDLVLAQKAVCEDRKRVKDARTFHDARFRDVAGTPIGQIFAAYASREDQIEIWMLEDQGAPDFLFMEPPGRAQDRYQGVRDQYAAAVRRARETFLDQVAADKPHLIGAERGGQNFPPEYWDEVESDSDGGVWDGGIMIRSRRAEDLNIVRNKPVGRPTDMKDYLETFDTVLAPRYHGEGTPWPSFTKMAEDLRAEMRKRDPDFKLKEKETVAGWLSPHIKNKYPDYKGLSNADKR